MKKAMKKMTGDSTAVAKVLPEMKGMQKGNATSYNKTNTFKKQPVPSYPYGQEFKAAKAPMSKNLASKGSTKK